MFNFFVFQTFQPLTTARLHLREFDPTDADALFRELRQPELAKPLGLTPIANIASARQAITAYRSNFNKRRSIRWAVTQRQTKALVGMCSLQQINIQHRRAEISYEIARSHWQKGYGTEAVQAIVDYGFTTMNLHRVEAIIEPDNAASIALANKVGFVYEGTLRQRFLKNGQFYDDAFYSLLQPDWHTNPL